MLEMIQEPQTSQFSQRGRPLKSSVFGFKVKPTQTSDFCRKKPREPLTFTGRRKGHYGNRGSQAESQRQQSSLTRVAGETTVEIRLDFHPAQRVAQRRLRPRLCLKRCVQSPRALLLASVSVSKGKLMQNACGPWH